MTGRIHAIARWWFLGGVVPLSALLFVALLAYSGLR